MTTTADRKAWQEIGDEALPEDDMINVIEAFLEGNGPSTEKEIAKAVGWARQVRVMNALLDGVLNGDIALYLQGGNIAFKRREHGDVQG